MQTLILCAFVGLTCAAWIAVICASQLAKAAELIDNESDDEGQA